MSNVYLGQIVQFGFQFAPQGFAYCNGALLPINQYTALFSLIGTYYGGNGQSNFALPNLSGRAAIGQFQSPGTSNFTIGQQGGTENATLNVTNLPSHNHPATFNATTAKATTQTAADGSLLAKTNDSTGTVIPQIYAPAGTAGTTAALGGLTVGLTGGNQPFAIRDPYLAINYCIATQGIYPSRN